MSELGFCHFDYINQKITLTVFTLSGFHSTVKPVYNRHPWDPKKWPLYRGGRYSEVAVNTVLTVFCYIMIQYLSFEYNGCHLMGSQIIFSIR
jgi:hypothetical protein